MVLTNCGLFDKMLKLVRVWLIDVLSSVKISLLCSYHDDSV